MQKISYKYLGLALGGVCLIVIFYYQTLEKPTLTTEIVPVQNSEEQTQSITATDKLTEDNSSPMTDQELLRKIGSDVITGYSADRHDLARPYTFGITEKQPVYVYNHTTEKFESKGFFNDKDFFDMSNAYFVSGIDGSPRIEPSIQLFTDDLYHRHDSIYKWNSSKNIYELWVSSDSSRSDRSLYELLPISKGGHRIIGWSSDLERVYMMEIGYEGTYVGALNFLRVQNGTPEIKKVENFTAMHTTKSVSPDSTKIVGVTYLAKGDTTSVFTKKGEGFSEDAYVLSVFDLDTNKVVPIYPKLITDPQKYTIFRWTGNPYDSIMASWVDDSQVKIQYATKEEASKFGSVYHDDEEFEKHLKTEVINVSELFKQ